VEELYGSSLGLIGFGRIGAEIARRARAFGVRCRAVTLQSQKPNDRDLLPLGLGSLTDSDDVDALVQSSDAVVVACELSGITSGLLDDRRMRLMRSNALLVNVARGPIVQEQALYDALRERRIAGAAIDVWYCYPQSDDRAPAMPAHVPFWELENVLMTPHASGWTAQAKERRLRFLAQCIARWHAGLPLDP
jgi:phosphoglycerate dehydrogenase-like enzyme